MKKDKKKAKKRKEKFSDLERVPRNTGNDQKRHQKRSETIGNDMREDFCLSLCVCATTGNDMRVM